MIYQKIVYEPNIRVYDEKDYCYMQYIFVNSICCYQGMHTSLEDCNSKFKEYCKIFSKEIVQC